MNIVERLHAMHRAWRYRLRTERDEIGYLLSLDLAGRTLVDVGAHRGAFTWWMQRKAGPAGRVIGFEPQPELHAYLGALASAFAWRNVTVEKLALSSRQGSAALARPRQHWGGASLEPVELFADLESIEVRLTTLDDYLERHPGPPVGFIKIDVQDHELSVLQGGVSVLRRDRPHLVFECLDHIFARGEIDALLRGLGYSGFFFHERRLTPVDRLAELRATIPARFLNYVYRPGPSSDSRLSSSA